MKLDEKRRVVEVLLCARNEANRRILNLAARGSVGTPSDVRGECYSAFENVHAKWDQDAVDALGGDEYWHTATEAAYRLIESSPTLRREFFGGAK